MGDLDLDSHRFRSLAAGRNLAIVFTYNIPTSVRGTSMPGVTTPLYISMRSTRERRKVSECTNDLVVNITQNI